MKNTTIFAALLLLLLAGCGNEPFPYTSVSGKVTYEDGSLIPAKQLNLTFVPQAPPIDPKTYPPRAMAIVDTATGSFDGATSRKYNDGLVRGKHKVVLSGSADDPLPRSVVPLDYTDEDTTPLEIDTANRPFHLKIKKPTKK